MVTPLTVKKTDGLRWKEAKAIAQAICAQMAADSPGKYLVNMSKEKRRAASFRTICATTRTATAVAPLSTGARRGATVSMPLTWAQVKKGLDPHAFTVRTVPRLIAKSRAWADYGKGARPLGKV